SRREESYGAVRLDDAERDTGRRALAHARVDQRLDRGIGGEGRLRRGRHCRERGEGTDQDGARGETEAHRRLLVVVLRDGRAGARTLNIPASPRVRAIRGAYVVV